MYCSICKEYLVDYDSYDLNGDEVCEQCFEEWYYDHIHYADEEEPLFCAECGKETDELIEFGDNSMCSDCFDRYKEDGTTYRTLDFQGYKQGE